MSYVVKCEDGKVRHVGVFDTLSGAGQWADYGHICLARHTVEYVVTTPVTCYVCEVTPATRLDTDLKYRPICDACYRPYAQLPA